MEEKDIVLFSMVFPSTQFALFFVLIFIPAIRLKYQPKAYVWYILLINIIFYSLFGLKFLLILIIDILVNYFIILLQSKYQKNKAVLIVGLILNIVLLGFFKYFVFTTNILLQAEILKATTFIPTILIPVGISFYTFKVIAHLMDTYRGELLKPKFSAYASYISFFPQITSGPIARAKEFYEDLEAPRNNYFNLGETTTLVLGGLFKKLVLASFIFNFIGGPFANPLNYSSLDLIIAAFAYSTMLYADFSGYSDMSNGISNLLGFRAPLNFNSPYKAVGFKDFWNRWHISLSSWFRDYLYIPLGGNRKGKLRKYINIFITMFVSGLWHGAGLNYIVWGTIHAVGSVLSHIFGETEYLKNFKDKGILNKFLKFTAQILTFFIITIAWIYFNSRNLSTANQFVLGMFSSDITQNTLINWRLIGTVIFIFGLNYFGEYIKYFVTKIINHLNLVFAVLIISALAYIIIRLGPDLMPPFVYFNF